MKQLLLSISKYKGFKGRKRPNRLEILFNGFLQKERRVLLKVKKQIVIWSAGHAMLPLGLVGQFWVSFHGFVLEHVGCSSGSGKG